VELLSEHICECIYCKKKYNVKELDKHKCIKKLTDTEFIDVDIDKMLNKTMKEDDNIIDAKKYLKNKNI
jgi:hypothetical protein